MNGLAPIYLYSRHYFSIYYWHVYPYIMPLVYPVGDPTSSNFDLFM